MTISPRDFVERMTLPVRQAMAAVRWLEGRVANNPKPGEATPAKMALSDADCVSQEILLTALRAEFPNVGIDAEEDTPGVAAFASNPPDPCVVIDPIDGTLHYLEQDGPYAVLVGLELAGRVEASLVGIPQSGELVRAVRGGGAEVSVDGATFRPATITAGGNRLLVSRGLDENECARLEAAGLELMPSCGAAIGVSPLLEGTVGGVRRARSEEGLSRRTWISALATQECGGAIATFDGALPERWQRGVRSVCVSRDKATLARLLG